MRILNDIIADLKEGKEVEYEEARLAAIVYSNLLFFANNNIKQLLGTKNPLVKSLVEEDYIRRHHNALKKSPEEWLGNDHPDNEEHKKFMEIGNKIFDHVIEKIMKDQMIVDEKRREESVPLKPYNIHHSNNTTIGLCPSCDTRVRNGIGGRDEECPRCKRKMKW